MAIEENDDQEKVRVTSGGLVGTGESLSVDHLAIEGIFSEIISKADPITGDEKEKIPERVLADLLNQLLAKQALIIIFKERGIEGELKLLTQGKTLEDGRKKPTEAVGYKLEVKIHADREKQYYFSREVIFDENRERNATGWHDPFYLEKPSENHKTALNKFDEEFVIKLIGEKLAEDKFELFC